MVPSVLQTAVDTYYAVWAVSLKPLSWLVIIMWSSTSFSPLPSNPLPISYCLRHLNTLDVHEGLTALWPDCHQFLSNSDHSVTLDLECDICCLGASMEMSILASPYIIKVNNLIKLLNLMQDLALWCHLWREFVFNFTIFSFLKNFLQLITVFK